MSAWEALGQSDEWYTPKYIFDALLTVFDLDVAAPSDGTRNVPCKRWLTKADDGLTAPWDGFVWMNPPFGGRNSLAPWLDRFFTHGDGVALTPDRTSAPWFQSAWSRADAVMFLPKVKFERPDGSLGKSPSTGTALWFIGPNAKRAFDHAMLSGLGIGATPSALATAA